MYWLPLGATKIFRMSYNKKNGEKVVSKLPLIYEEE